MGIGQIEAHAFEFEVDIGVDPGIVAEFRAISGILHGILSDDGRIGRRIVLRKIANVRTQLRGEDAGDLKLQIDVAPAREHRERKHIVV